MILCRGPPPKILRDGILQRLGPNVAFKSLVLRVLFLGLDTVYQCSHSSDTSKKTRSILIISGHEKFRGRNL